MPELIEALKTAVFSDPGQTGRFYARVLRRNGFPMICRKDVNRILYNRPETFTRLMNGDTPQWFLVVGPTIDESIIDDLKKVIFYYPGFTGRHYARILRGDGYPWITKRDVNRILYGYTAIFYHETSDGKPEWFLTEEYEDELFAEGFDEDDPPDDWEEPVMGPEADDEVDESDYPDADGDEDEDEDEDVEWSDEIDLYDWQIRALDAWRENKYKGVVEAVTGAGKTHVALAAMEAHLYQGWKVVVLVPSIALQRQWANKIDTIINWELGNDYKVSLLGGNNRPSVGWDILIAVANSAARHQLLPFGAKGLLIADECHRFGADTWSRGLKPGFSRRLGLTATLERSDNGLERKLMPYFKERCYQLEYEEALDDDVIAHFKIAFLGVDFEDDEAAIYEDANDRCRKMRNKLINNHGLSSEPFGEFMKEVSRLSNGGGG